MMRIARADNRAILEDNIDGFSELVDLQNLTATTQLFVPAFITRVVELVDPETGFAINSQKSVIHINLELITIGDPVKGWLITYPDSEGTILLGRVTRVDPDKTLNFVSLIVGVD